MAGNKKSTKAEELDELAEASESEVDDFLTKFSEPLNKVRAVAGKNRIQFSKGVTASPSNIRNHFLGVAPMMPAPRLGGRKRGFKG